MKIGVCELIPDVKYKVTGRRHDCGKLNQKIGEGSTETP